MTQSMAPPTASAAIKVKPTSRPTPAPAEEPAEEACAGPPVHTPYPITPAAYNHLAEAGYFEGRRVELIRGRILEMPPMGPDHHIARRKIDYRLRDHFPLANGFVVEGQVPLRLPDSEPEPDVFVFRGNLDDEAGGENEVLLVVEAAKTSLTFDRTTKLALYAEAGYRDYWILNLVDRVLEVYRNPIQSAGAWTYADKTTVPADGAASPLAKPEATIPVADLLPRD